MGWAAIVARWHVGLAALRRGSGPPPRPSRWALVADMLLAAALAAGTVNGFLSRDYDGRGLGVPVGPLAPVPYLRIPPQYAPMTWPQSAVWVVLALLSALPVAARRRYPLAAYWVLLLASVWYHLQPGFEPWSTFTACVIMAYSAVMYSPYRVPAIASVLLGALLLAGRHQADVPGTKPGLLFFLLLVPVALAANAVHSLKERVRVVEAEREAASQLAVQRERARIAQELHDVVTHNVSVMVVQAGAARSVLSVAPDKARDALLAIEAGGRAAMSELRHVMGLLSMDGGGCDPAGPEDLAPPPGLGQLDALAARVRGSGVPVELVVTGTPGSLPAGVDLAAYRVVQEALTNAMKHAMGARVRIAIDHGPGALCVEVRDSGGTPAPNAHAGNGRGIIGLRERLAVYGGTLEAVSLPLGGYRVRAVIPCGAQREPVLGGSRIPAGNEL